MKIKRVVMAKVTTVGWNGDLQVRLDIGPVGGKATTHIYVPTDDDLAGVPVGTTIYLSAWIATALKTGGKK